MQRLSPRTGSGVPQPAASAEGRIVGEEDWQRCRRILEASAIRQGGKLKRNLRINPALFEKYGVTENCRGRSAAVKG